MMKWYQSLCLGSQAKEKEDELRDASTKRLPNKNLYFVTLPTNEKNLYDIYSHAVLLQEHYQQLDMKIVGIGYGKKDAMEVAGELVTAAVCATGNPRGCYAAENFLPEWPQES